MPYDHDPVEVWIQALESDTTRETYSYAIKKLLAAMNMTGQEALKRAREDSTGFWNYAKSTATKFPASGRHKALNALRTFLRSNGVYPPWDRLQFPKRKKSAALSWGEALAIVHVARPPYSHIFNLMLHCGWGVQQFLLANTVEGWGSIRIFLAKNTEACYYRQDLESRKASPQPFYSLVPTKLLQNILQTKTPLPFVTKRGAQLGMGNYKSSRIALDSAWKEALRRTPTPRGQVKLHELRDTFKTSGTRSGAAYEAVEFALGHELDPRGYEKCWSDESWMWSEISKIYEKYDAPEITPVSTTS